MKNTARLIALLLAAAMLLTMAVACKKKEEVPVDTTASGTVATGGDKDTFKVAKTDWGKDFNILCPNWGSYVSYFFYDSKIEAGDQINDALYQRTQQIKDYLGVNIVNMMNDDMASGTKFSSTLEKLTNSISAGDDTYQLYLTHTFQAGVAAMVTEGYAYNLLEEKEDGTKYFPDLNLEASWWNLDAMETLGVSGKLYFGYNDFMIADPNAVFFNKTMQENYKVSDLYAMVREGTWTLENMILESYKVDEGGDKSTKNLGFAAAGEWYFMSFLDSCDTGVIIDEGGYKTLNMGADNERYANVYDLIDELCKSDSSLIYKEEVADVADKDKAISSGRVLFTLVALHKASVYRGTDVKFGILPYPKYDADQLEYRSFDWSGLMCVPISVQNTVMVGQVIESLGYFSSHAESGDSVYTAYYEKLLGTKISDAPDDYAMLQLIYDGICYNPVINMISANSGTTNSGLGALAYAYQKLAKSYIEGETTKPNSVSVQWAQNKTQAQAALDATING